jgi:glycosyltransferase involved in cell wall biosynthesis
MFVVAHNGARIFGGGEIGTAKLLGALQARGHRVLMLCRDAEIARRVGELGIPTATHRIGGVLMLQDALRFAALLRGLRPDALVLTTVKKLLLAGLGARMAGVPLIVQRVVLSNNLPRRPTQRWAFRHLPDVITLNADVMRTDLLRADPRLAGPSVVTLYDGVMAPRASATPGSVRRALGISAEAKVIGSLARLGIQKRLDRLVRALASLPGAHLVVAGEGPLQAELEALADERGVRERVHLLGHRKDVGDVLAALDLYVVSSDSEGMANAMLEAMMFGLPVVSTDVSGAREALEPGGDGVAPGLVVGFDDDALVAPIADLLGDDARRLAMGEAARRVAEERFGWERFVDEWERLLASGSRR